MNRADVVTHLFHRACHSVQTDRYGAVIMEAMAKNWLEERFDRIDQRFDEVDRRFEQVDRRFEQVDRRFEQVDTDLRELRVEMNSRFDSVDVRFAAMQRLIIQVGGGMIATMLIGFLGIIATQL